MPSPNWSAIASALLTACAATNLRAAEPTLAMTDAINSQFSKPAQQTDDEKPLAAFTLEFTQAVKHGDGVRARDLRQSPGSPRVDDDAHSDDRQPTLVESLVAAGYPKGNLRQQIKSNARVTGRYLHRSVAPAPERDPRFISGQRLLPIDNVALRFRDEMPMAFGGVTFTR